MPFEDHMIREGEAITEAQCSTSELVDMALGQRIEPPSFDLNAKALQDSWDADDQPPPITKAATPRHRARLVPATFTNNPSEFNLTNVTNPHAISEQLNEIHAAHLKWQHQQTIDSFFKSTQQNSQTCQRHAKEKVHFCPPANYPIHFLIKSWRGPIYDIIEQHVTPRYIIRWFPETVFNLNVRNIP